MIKIKQNLSLKIVRTVFLLMGLVWIIIGSVFLLIHINRTTSFTKSTAYYYNGRLTYQVIEQGYFEQVESPYEDDALESTYITIYYDPANPTKCYVENQIDLIYTFDGMGLCFVIVSCVISFIILRRTRIQTNIIMNGQTVTAEIKNVEIKKDSNNNKYIILHTTFLDPFTGIEYSFDSPNIRDKELFKNQNVEGTAIVHFLRKDPKQYVMSAYEYKNKRNY